MRDCGFQEANQVMTAMLKELRRKGLYTTTHKDALEPEDVQKLYQSGVPSNKNPLAIQRKVDHSMIPGMRRSGKSNSDTHQNEFAMMNRLLWKFQFAMMNRLPWKRRNMIGEWPTVL